MCLRPLLIDSHSQWSPEQLCSMHLYSATEPAWLIAKRQFGHADQRLSRLSAISIYLPICKSPWAACDFGSYASVTANSPSFCLAQRLGLCCLGTSSMVWNYQSLWSCAEWKWETRSIDCLGFCYRWHGSGGWSWSTFTRFTLSAWAAMMSSKAGCCLLLRFWRTNCWRLRMSHESAPTCWSMLTSFGSWRIQPRGT